jgi:predicted anti-sigma-YlaC factor YlaD
MTWSTIKMLLALRCDESTRLVSESLDRDLPAVERWAVRLHAISCRSCRPFRKQVQFLRRALTMQSEIDPPAAVAPDQTLSDDARSRIAKAIADESPQNSF